MRHLCSTILLLALAVTVLSGCADDKATPEPDEPRLRVQKLVTISEMDAMSLPGQVVPASTDTITLWLGSGVARRDVQNGSLLVHAAQDRLTWLDHGNRTWTSQTGAELSRQLAAIAADTLGVPDDDPRLDQLRRMLNVAVKVTDTEEEDIFDGYRCRRWVVEQRMGDQSTVSELWLTGDLPVDWALLHRITQPTLSALPGGQNALAELARLDGFPVRSFAVLEVMGRKGRTETRLVSAESVEVPEGHFLPPEGYLPSGPTTPAQGPTR